MKKAKEINFLEGVKWTEEEVGTNAIGTALRTREPIAVVGLDHYAVASQQWVCSAAPIYDENKEFLGIIDMSYPIYHGLSDAQDYVLATIVAASYTIEQQLRIQQKENLLELFRHGFQMEDSASYSVVCDDQENIVWANHRLRSFCSSTIDQPLQQFCQRTWKVFSKVPIFSSVYGHLIGYKVTLQKAQDEEAFSCSLPSFRFDGVIGTSPSFAAVLRSCSKVAKTDATVYLAGETGTGKELIARAIHQNSLRKDGPFVAVNCGAVPKELIGSELFGYVEGAFTGAKRTGYMGKFVQAHGGTLFLDEIGEIPLEMQVALLRVLQEREVVPIGGTKPISVDVRVITATHRDLYELVKKGKLREDLFYRLHVYPIKLPALRERKEDIPFFVDYYCRKNGWNVCLPNSVMNLLMDYYWPGNIRELFNVLERMRIEYGEAVPPISEIKSMLVALKNDEKGRGELTYREQVEKEQMMNMLEETKGNISKMAELLGISRSTCYRKLKKYKLI
ncbi:sigma-54-dependent Fis family transcriptional regulator [Geobacillus proteiniphilus]|uniref:Sigma-54-dependent Fis family transcriptional regulator n=2 Tax=Geobacillus TaxID=129337 RepID=A0ABY9ME96_9BACL|nr:sigma-54-dependent Fis family transcriptional regulator [Geobacillus proteiniphilus]WMJ15118.1 sigma-54-dependent Fis family transcriptional regulator [Geobacillus proteiniphilus]